MKPLLRAGLALVFAIALAIAARGARSATFRIAAPQREGRDWIVPMTVPAQTLKRTEVHALETKLVLFVPGVSARPRDVALDDGPFSRIKVVQVERGVAITLFPRGSMSQLAERIHLRGGDNPALVTSARDDGPVASPAASQAARPVSPAAKPATLPSPALHATQPFATSPARGEAGAGGAVLPYASAAVGTPTASALAMMVALAATCALWLRKKRRASLQPAAIEVIATQAVGPKQKLVVVDAGGERFLLAACDKEVRLLSTLAGEPSTKEPFADVLADQTGASEVPADLAGVLRLARRRDSIPAEVAA